MTAITALTVSVLLEQCTGRSAQDVQDACDAAIAFLVRHGCSSPSMLRAFLRSVEREIRRVRPTVAATLTTPGGDAGAERSRVLSALEETLHASVDLTERADLDLLGGARLAVNDDRLDASLRGALEHLSTHLRSLSP